MRGRSGLTVLALAGTVAVGVVGLAQAAAVSIPMPTLLPSFNGSFSPKQMPKSEYVPVTARIAGEIRTRDGSHPPALREAVVDVDRDLRVNVEGLPVCEGGRRDILDPKGELKACSKAIVGRGSGYFAIAFPEQKPLIVNSPITVFNGGERDGEVKLLIHTLIPVPKPAPIVAVATIRRKGSGAHSVLQIPVVAGGAGSLGDFEIRLGRTYTYNGRMTGLLEARCPGGKFKVTVPKLRFKNEAGTPNEAATTTLRGSLAVPCTPKG